MKMCKLACFGFLSCVYITSSLSHEQYLKNIIAKYQLSIPIYVSSDAYTNLGFNNCDLKHNGESRVIKCFIKKGFIIIDAGANVGDWSISAMEAAQFDCRVYAFEPVPTIYSRLKKLEQRYNGMVQSFNFALGKEESVREMNAFLDHGGPCSTFFNRPVLNNLPAQKIKVPVKTLDGFVREQSIHHIDFLKIDTEGAEFDILQGAQTLLDQGAIDVIQFEYGGTYNDAGIKLSQVFNYLTSKNYLVFRIFSGGLIYIPEWEDRLENFQYSNYLAIRS